MPRRLSPLLATLSILPGRDVGLATIWVMELKADPSSKPAAVMPGLLPLLVRLGLCMAAAELEIDSPARFFFSHMGIVFNFASTEIVLVFILR